MDDNQIQVPVKLGKTQSERVKEEHQKQTLKSKLSQEFRDLSIQAVEYKTKIATAKTQLKKDYYKVKLEKINKQVYGTLAKLSMIEPELTKDLIKYKAKPKNITKSSEEAVNEE